VKQAIEALAGPMAAGLAWVDAVHRSMISRLQDNFSLAVLDDFLAWISSCARTDLLAWICSCVTTDSCSTDFLQDERFAGPQRLLLDKVQYNLQLDVDFPMIPMWMGTL
jgi:hypothetical protein